MKILAVGITVCGCFVSGSLRMSAAKLELYLEYRASFK